ncbi:oxidoreductase C-terminal domain-containing protein [Streptomyces sp. KR55]|uniref:oxidoreductase C-terminal domain-containing protein n=1 Tax=Streptomyces sp. KR55 TaxID=3457425 RepID=UPI003FD2065D
MKRIVVVGASAAGLAAGTLRREGYEGTLTLVGIEHRTNAAEQGMAAARNLLRPEARRPFAPVPYFWSDQYDMRVQVYGFLCGHDEVAVVDGSLEERRFLAAYRTGDRVTGVLAVGMPPRAIRVWRQAIAAGAVWQESVPASEGTG